jgi:hypothetical protein
LFQTYLNMLQIARKLLAIILQNVSQKMVCAFILVDLNILINLAMLILTQKIYAAV